MVVARSALQNSSEEASIATELRHRKNWEGAHGSVAGPKLLGEYFFVRIVCCRLTRGDGNVNYQF